MLNRLPAAAARPDLFCYQKRDAMTKISSSDTVVRDNDLLFSAVNNEMVIFQIRQDTYFALDEIGTDIWQRLAQPCAVAELCRDLVQDYDADYAVIERDVLTLLNAMAAADLVQVVAS